MKGELPAQADEIAIDRMYADNNSLEIGDTIESADGKYSWKITGYVALPDYSCLFSDNSDTMFDAVSLVSVSWHGRLYGTGKGRAKLQLFLEI